MIAPPRSLGGPPRLRRQRNLVTGFDRNGSAGYVSATGDVDEVGIQSGHKGGGSPGGGAKVLDHISDLGDTQRDRPAVVTDGLR